MVSNPTPIAIVIDDDHASRRLMRSACEGLNFEVHEASRGDEGYSFIEKKCYDLILADDMMPGMDGVELIELSRKNHPEVPIVLISGYTSVARSVKAMSSGADYVIEKPIKPSALMEILSWLIEKKKNHVSGRAASPKTSIKGNSNSSIVSKFEGEMEELAFLIDRVARTDSTILVSGESGTGKELVARSIHQQSRRSKGPFVPVNCGAIPETLLESELFGYARGAFSGAIRDKAGRFQLSHRGTIFLDEVGEMSAAFQVKLLRVLQEGSFEPVGGTTQKFADFRVIAATNRKLSEMVEQGSFREDLYYRLCVIEIDVPPLRRRTEDILPLVEHFTAGFNKRHEINTVIRDKDLLRAMRTYPWPGNVRELENLIERLCILKNAGEVLVGDLPARYQTAPRSPSDEEERMMKEEGLDFNEAVDNFERRMITQALKRTNGNKSRAAALLGLNRTTLLEKLKKKGLT